MMDSEDDFAEFDDGINHIALPKAVPILPANEIYYCADSKSTVIFRTNNNMVQAYVISPDSNGDIVVGPLAPNGKIPELPRNYVFEFLAKENYRADNPVNINENTVMEEPKLESANPDKWSTLLNIAFVVLTTLGIGLLISLLP